MAGDTVEKKYLVNVKSNLDKYAKQADEAAVEVAKLKAQIAGLSEEEKENGVEVEKLNAQYRTAQKEYKDAKRLVDLQTQANNSNANSRKQLAAIVQLEQRRLGELADQYEINEKGQRVLSKAYIEQVQRLKDAKDAIIEYDKAQSDGRSSVGMYTEAIQESGQSLLAMLSPAALVAAAVAGLKVVFDGVKEAIMSTTFAMNIVNKSSLILKQIFYDIAINGKLSVQSILEASKAADTMNEARVKQYRLDYQAEQKQREINENLLIYSDQTKTDAERLDALTKAKQLNNEQTDIQLQGLKAQLEANAALRETRPYDEKLLAEQYQIMTQITQVQARSDASMKEIESQRTGIMKKMADERANAMKAASDEATKAAIDNMNAEKKQVNELLNNMKDFVNEHIFLVDQKKNADIDQLKHNEEVTEQNKKYMQGLINADNILTEQWIANRDAAANALGTLSEALGTETELSKVFSAAQAVINTWTAASMTLRDPTIPSTFARIATMASVIITGLNTVRNIMKVDTSGGSVSTGSTGSAVRTSFAVPRAVAEGVPVFAPQNLTQAQLNALPNQNLLTAEDITNAFKEIPAPIVTVEAIEAKTNEYNKVQVRANI